MKNTHKIIIGFSLLMISSLSIASIPFKITYTNDGGFGSRIEINKALSSSECWYYHDYDNKKKSSAWLYPGDSITLYSEASLSSQSGGTECHTAPYGRSLNYEIYLRGKKLYDASIQSIGSWYQQNRGIVTVGSYSQNIDNLDPGYDTVVGSIVFDEYLNPHITLIEEKK